MSRRWLALVALAGLVALADGFLLWGRTVVSPVPPALALRRHPPGRDAPAVPGSRPAAGLYRYRTTGNETVDRFGIDRRYPAETVRVISHQGGSRWRETIPIFGQHLETYDFLTAGGDAQDRAYATRLTYFFVPGVQRFSCPEPGRRLLWGAAPGTSWRWRCAEGRSTSDNLTVYVGTEPVRVGAWQVPARHLRLATALAGTSTGGAVRDLWLDPSGLVLREQRLVSLRVRSVFVGLVTYQERATFELVSPVPER